MTHTSYEMTIEQKNLLRMIAVSLAKDSWKDRGTTGLDETDKPDKLAVIPMTHEQWEKLIDTGVKHAVLPLLYDVLMEQDITREQKAYVDMISQAVVKKNYQLLFESARMVQCLEENNIPVVVLKGSVTGQYYPCFETRKTGDVDLLITPDNLTKAHQVMIQAGYHELNDNHSLHHREYMNDEKLLVELHTMMAEPVDDRTLNQKMEQLVEDGLQSRIRVNVMEGVELPSLKESYHSYYLILHMLQHFLRKGFGFKLLCDWVVFWNGEQTRTTRDEIVQLLNDTGLLTFVRTMTAICVKYMGLNEQKAAFLGFEHVKAEDESMLLEELWDAEEFGESSKNRMVMTKGTSLWHLFLEFHHQMRINYRDASKIVIIWPVLWVMTLAGFVRNNRKVRGVSSQAVLQNAKQRSRLMKHMKIFKE